MSVSKRFGDYTLIASTPGGHSWVIEAYTMRDGKLWLPVGEATFTAYLEPTTEDDEYSYSGLKQTGLKGWDVKVDPDHRRKGLASAMYSFAKNAFAMPIHAGDFQTPDGGSFLKKRKELSGMSCLPSKCQRGVDCAIWKFKAKECGKSKSKACRRVRAQVKACRRLR